MKLKIKVKKLANANFIRGMEKIAMLEALPEEQDEWRMETLIQFLDAQQRVRDNVRRRTFIRFSIPGKEKPEAREVPPEKSEAFKEALERIDEVEISCPIHERIKFPAKPVFSNGILGLNSFERMQVKELIQFPVEPTIETEKSELEQLIEEEEAAEATTPAEPLPLPRVLESPVAP